MAEIRNRETVANIVTPNKDSIIEPNQETKEPTNNYDSILQRIQELENQNRELTQKVAQSNGDISEQVKDAKRNYGYEADNKTRRPSELFKHKYNVLINDRIEKVVINTETIGRPVMQTNYNTGKKVYNHNITVTFADETTIEMDVLDYINEKYTYEDFVKDENIKIIDVQNKKGEFEKIKFFTFETKQFGTFTIPEYCSY